MRKAIRTAQTITLATIIHNDDDPRDASARRVRIILGDDGRFYSDTGTSLQEAGALPQPKDLDDALRILQQAYSGREWGLEMQELDDAEVAFLRDLLSEINGD